jgi:hypothetical protein
MPLLLDLLVLILRLTSTSAPPSLSTTGCTPTTKAQREMLFKTNTTDLSTLIIITQQMLNVSYY